MYTDTTPAFARGFRFFSFFSLRWPPFLLFSSSSFSLFFFLSRPALSSSPPVSSSWSLLRSSLLLVLFFPPSSFVPSRRRRRRSSSSSSSLDTRRLLGVCSFLDLLSTAFCCLPREGGRRDSSDEIKRILEISAKWSIDARSLPFQGRWLFVLSNVIRRCSEIRVDDFMANWVASSNVLFHSLLRNSDRSFRPESNPL